MVRAQFELPIAEGSWEDAIELVGTYLPESPDAESPAESHPVFDSNAEARRIEDWIAFNLDESGQFEPHSPFTSRDLFQSLDRLATFTHTHQAAATPRTERALKRRPSPPEAWPRFHLLRRRGVLVLRLIDRSLVKTDQIEELATSLFDLIDAGHDRIVLNFSGVERLGSVIATALAEAHRRCSSFEGGALRVCKLQPQLTGIVAIPGLVDSLSTYADEVSAIESPWPSRPSTRALPIEILSFLKLDMKQSEPRPNRHRGGSHIETRVDPPFDGPPRIWLIHELGQGAMRSIGVDKNRFLIGRNRDCDLPLDSIHVSKRHAAIERRGGLDFLRDMGSTNGTQLNGRILRKQDAEIRAGDRIQIGDLRFVVSPSARGRGEASEAIGETVIEWVRDDESECSPFDANAATLRDFTVFDTPAEDPKPFKYEVIEDVLVITPRIHQFSDDSTVAALRSKLGELFDQPLPRRVVVSLEFVAQLSPQAIGALLAHQLRLERAGGGLRLCNASYKLMAFLDRIHFSMLMECYPKLDDAILIAWD